MVFAEFLISGIVMAMATVAAADDAKDAKSHWPVVVREEQGGIAGTSVSEWKVEKSGKWTVIKFTVSDGKEMEGTRTQKSGTLTAKQLTSLTESIKTHKPGELPATLGTASKVNRHDYILTVGEQKVTVAGVDPRFDSKAKGNILSAAPKDEKSADSWKRVAGLVDAVIQATGVE